ncbi:terminase small subunit [Streptococcus suis]|uniref:terminase small subunit n=1 Tax=Streptococcus suis TaxID=1307 RepID=UPI000CF55A9C|nr:terminase small subunit [Streptococcus suis]QZT18641.1 terminase small subunit [Streptococcus suis]HEM2864649.1 terminase small subunit [Streptococcus suis]
MKQRKFIDEYIICGNATEAAIKAGYSQKTAGMAGSENLKKPYIKSAIDERLMALESQKIAKQDEILRVFTSILRQELTEEVTELNQVTGEFVTIEKRPSIAEVIKAGSELMKRYPTALELQKIELEIEKLKTQVTVDNKTELALDKLFDKLEEEINGN